MNKEKYVQKNYNILPKLITMSPDGEHNIAAKMWNKHVKIEEQAIKQIRETASLNFVKPYVAVMPDSHFGMGATVGSVVPTQGAIIPAAVGVDIGCGIMAVRTNIPVSRLGEREEKSYDDATRVMFKNISLAIPHGRSNDGGAGDIGAWSTIWVNLPQDIRDIWDAEFQFKIVESAAFNRHQGALSKNAARHLGTLGTGNHFIEVCTEIDNPDSNLWVVIHSGSRGFGNRIGTYWTKVAGDLCRKWGIQLPNRDLGYLPEGTQEYDDYIEMLNLAQKFAWRNREIMMARVLTAIGATECNGDRVYGNDGDGIPSTIHMHHNYMAKYQIGKDKVNLTRKGAVDASKGNWVVIPGSMGAKTYIGIGLGNPESFDSCSHGAGRAMSRTEALKTFTLEDHAKATEGVVCDKSRGVLDETPASYKSIDDVMESQRDLVEPVLKIKQLVCVKGISE